MWRPENEDKALKPNQNPFYNKVNQENVIIIISCDLSVSEFNYYALTKKFLWKFSLWDFLKYSLPCCFS